MLGVLIERFREVLRSRELFSNWPLAAIQYAFINPRVLYSALPGIVRDLSKSCIRVRCRSGGEVCINPVLYAQVVRYWYFGFIKRVECDPGNNALIINGLMVRLSFHDDYIDLGSVKFKHYYHPIAETFIDQVYSIAYVKNRVVVDVGAFVGDSPIYFVLKGAKKVYAIEPHPGACREMIENIALNNMQDKIIPINAALGSKSDIVKIADVGIEMTISTYHGSISNGATEVPMITLEQLIEDYGAEPDVLKMDCEGCEFDVIMNDYEHVKLFRELLLEVHGDEKELLSRLSKDYKCVMYEKQRILHCKRQW
ncbi:FkbM family methyltransferase [Vulcanisaeta souniana]|uniref:FkbM family methyltransferase n=1 Tax=Vulcanisaeta souniana JCM 11219 TaxID=1293586 RepID=A0ABM8BNS9_9CREN|nr:FkbM family methyltransferase [Vulcanisaeta souniana]BDR92689.1 FkbM family methyltransferase [Vulcanisaeta souniana JCM 11219]